MQNLAQKFRKDIDFQHNVILFIAWAVLIGFSIHAIHKIFFES